MQGSGQSKSTVWEHEAILVHHLYASSDVGITQDGNTTIHQTTGWFDEREADANTNTTKIQVDRQISSQFSIQGELRR